jgi:cytidylate kinase
VSQNVVAIDGPSGTGKTTVSRLVAARLGLPYLDTGAFYRAATHAAINAGIDIDDGEAIAALLAGLRLEQEHNRTFINEVEVSEAIRSAEVTSKVSVVSAHPEVRAILVDRQREWVESHDGRAVVEGRDIGSVVFPDAEVKIYLDASAPVRAGRRAIQDGDDPEAVLESIRQRDHIDSTRTTSPLTVADDARVIDTSDLNLDEVVDLIVDLVSD